MSALLIVVTAAPRWTKCTCEPKPATLPLTFPALPEPHDEGCPLDVDNAEIQAKREQLTKEAA